ncbi:MAG TPA: citrate synthase/methylcitrate synthase, partial [Planctomycetes bacterium]|nr:citrate synthase/methylcitrate synthase [Planctomycetota bacterium]
RGRSLAELAGRVPFEEAVGLLWGCPVAGLREELGRARAAAFAGAGRLGDALARAEGMDALRAALGHGLGEGEPAPVEILGACAVYAAAWWRGQQGLEPVAPDPALGHAADLLRMIRGEAASAEEARALDAYLVTVIDHGLNASTFTARVVASTRSDR